MHDFGDLDLPRFELAVVAYFGDGGEVAEFLVVGDLGDGPRLGLVFGVVFGEEHRGDLEAEEEVAGAFGVDVVGGDALEDLGEGELDGGAVFELGEGEGGGAAAARGEVQHGSAGGVVVVAEGLVAEAGGGAAAAVGEDVAALHLGGGFGGFGHGGLLWILLKD